MEERREEQDRGEQVLAAAERIMLQSGAATISFNDIAAEVGVSRSLLYTYYDGVPQIVDELFRRRVSELQALIEETEAGQPDFGRRIDTIFLSYLAHLVERGPIASLILRERKQDSPLSEESSRLFRRVLHHLARDVSQNLNLGPRESFVLLELLAAIPESLAKMVREDQVSSEVAEQTCSRLVSAAVAAMEVDQD